jgi:hypothetical protein
LSCGEKGATEEEKWEKWEKREKWEMGEKGEKEGGGPDG